MSKATILDAVLKLVAFIPLAILVYYTDIPAWFNRLYQDHLSGLLIGALSIFVYGVFLKRKIISAHLENWRSSFAGGLIAVSASVAVFITGTVYMKSSFLHYESLILLTLGYLLFRFDVRFVRQLIPLLAICGLVFVPSILMPYFGHFLSGTLTISIMFATFGLLYTWRNTRTLLVPALVLAIGFAYWLGQFQQYFLFAMPAIVVMFTVPSRLRKSTEIRGRNIPPTCVKHVRAADMEDYCVICGRKLYASQKIFRLNILGLIVVVIVILSVLAAVVPVLSFEGNNPYTTTYRYSGVTSNIAPQTPSGWLVNSSKTLNLSGDLYATKIVYVPSYHPEVRNYTLVYAIGRAPLYLGPGTGEDLLGWNITLHNPFSVGPLQGAVTVYQTRNTMMMNFAGNSQMEFKNGSSFEFLAVGASFTRVFNGLPLSNATFLFEHDLNSSFAPIFASEATSSTWTKFLYDENTRFNQLFPAFIALITASAIAWITYTTDISDYRIDRLINRVSILGSRDYSLFERLSGQGSRERTTLEIAESLPEKEWMEAKGENFSSLLLALERLRVRRVIRPVLSERGSEILYSWKVLT